MGRGRRFRAVLVTAVAAGLIAGPSASTAGAQAKTCKSAAGSYEVTPPRAASTDGADPAALAAANCQLGFREDRTYPLSVILLCLLATAGTLIVLRRGISYDPIASEA